MTAAGLVVVLAGLLLSISAIGALAGAGFAVETLGEGYTPKAPRFAGWMEWGVARRAEG